MSVINHVYDVHYTAIIRSPYGSWFMYNDDEVTKYDFKKLNLTEPYMFVYSRQFKGSRIESSDLQIKVFATLDNVPQPIGIAANIKPTVLKHKSYRRVMHFTIFPRHSIFNMFYLTFSRSSTVVLQMMNRISSSSQRRR